MKTGVGGWEGGTFLILFLFLLLDFFGVVRVEVRSSESEFLLGEEWWEGADFSARDWLIFLNKNGMEKEEEKKRKKERTSHNHLVFFFYFIYLSIFIHLEQVFVLLAHRQQVQAKIPSILQPPIKKKKCSQDEGKCKFTENKKEINSIKTK